MRNKPTTFLSAREILRPTLGRILFTAIPFVWGLINAGIYYDSELIDVLFLLFGKFSVFVLVPFIFATMYLVMPFQLILEPVGLWSYGLLSGPTEKGFVVIVIGYMIIFYFLFAARKVIWRELKKIFKGEK